MSFVQPVPKKGMNAVASFIAKKYKAVKDPLGRIVEQKTGEKVSHWYSQRSKVLGSTAEMRAVKLKNGTKGWLRPDGKFVSEQDIRNMLHSLDSTEMGQFDNISLLDIYDNLTPQQKAEFAEKFEHIDWERFWKEEYWEIEGLSERMDAYEELILTFGLIAKW
jgi:hypothetical protein